jgi:hypothetical protein
MTVTGDLPPGFTSTSHGFNRGGNGEGPRHPLSASVERRGLRMLELPRRGDRVAKRWCGGAALIYLVLAITLILTLKTSDDQVAQRAAEAAASLSASPPIDSVVPVTTNAGVWDSMLALVGWRNPRNITVFLLVIGGVLLTGRAAFSLWADIRSMKREEDDLEWIRLTGSVGLRFVFLDEKEREKYYRRFEQNPDEWDYASHENTRVETLADDRVRRVIQARTSTSASHVSADEMRAVAEKRTAQYGSFARYSASLLLLLAVLGTFAGVKTALPGLIAALGSSSAQGPGTVNALITPLQAIAAAFGGNALALVGAIAVGFAAQGVSFGRRNLLERLELLSAEHIYGSDVSTTTDPIQAAVKSLERTSHEFKGAADTISGVEAGLATLSADLRKSFSSLEEKLALFAEKQDDTLYTRTRQTLDELQQRIGTMTDAVRANALAHAGLVDSIKLRAEETRSAIEKMEDANIQLRNAFENLAGMKEESARTFSSAQQMFQSANNSFIGLKTSVDKFAGEGAKIASQVESLGQLAQDIPSNLRGLDARVGVLSIQFAEAQNAAAKSWTELGASLLETNREIAAQSNEAASSASEAAAAATKALKEVQVRSSGTGMDGEAQRSLHRIAALLENSQRSRANGIVDYLILAVVALMAGGGAVAVALLLR